MVIYDTILDLDQISAYDLIHKLQPVNLFCTSSQLLVTYSVWQGTFCGLLLLNLMHAKLAIC